MWNWSHYLVACVVDMLHTTHATKRFIKFLIQRLELDKRANRKLVNASKLICEKVNNQSSSTNNHLIFKNYIILTNIFEHVVNTKISWDQKDLLNCRLVSKSWNDSVRLILQKNFAKKFRIIIDDLVCNPNYLADQLQYKIHRMKELKFDAMNIRILQMEDNTNANNVKKAVLKFNQDFSSFINHPDFHPLKVLTMKIDYFTPNCILLTKFSHSLEEIDIQIKIRWIKDEIFPNKSGFPEDLVFPKLKKLTLDFRKREGDDFEKLSESKSLAKLL